MAGLKGKKIVMVLGSFQLLMIWCVTWPMMSEMSLPAREIGNPMVKFLGSNLQLKWSFAKYKQCQNAPIHKFIF